MSSDVRGLGEHARLQVSISPGCNLLTLMALVLLGVAFMALPEVERRTVLYPTIPIIVSLVAVTKIVSKLFSSWYGLDPETQLKFTDNTWSTLVNIIMVLILYICIYLTYCK